MLSKESCSYISRNRNPEKKFLVFKEMGLSYILGNGNPPKKFFKFQETELSYISGRTSEALKTKVSTISLKKFMNIFFQNALQDKSFHHFCKS